MKAEKKPTLNKKYLAEQVVETIELLKKRQIFGHQGQAIKGLIQMSLQESRKEQETGANNPFLEMVRDVVQLPSGKGD